MSTSKGDIAKSLMLTSWERYDKALGRAGIGLLGAVVGYLQVSQYLALHQDIRDAASRLAQLKATEDTMQDLDTGIDKLRTEVETEIESEMSDFVPHLRLLFVALDDDYPGHLPESFRSKMRSPSEASPPEPTTDRRVKPIEVTAQSAQIDVPNMASQSSQSQRPIELSEQSKSELAAVQNLDGLAGALHRVAEREIITPVFESLNAGWDKRGRPKTLARLDIVVAGVERAETSFPDPAEKWRAVRAALTKVRDAITSFRFQPPKEPLWWRTVGGKVTTGVSLVEDANETMSKQLPQDVLRAVGSELAAALQNKSEVAAQLVRDQSLSEARYAQFSERIGALGKPFELLSLDLKSTSEHLPALIGIAFAAGVIWVGYWRSRLLRASQWLRLSEPDIGSIGPFPASGVLQGNGSLGSLAAIGILGLGWVTIASVQLHQSGVQPAWGVSSVCAVGALAVAASVAVCAKLLSVRDNVRLS